jgi:phosphodiesterase/alkaline phosphatase D-like protein
MDLNGSGQLAVADTSSNSVTFYSPSATGNAPPAATISGSSTGLYGPGYVAFTPPPVAATRGARDVYTTRAVLSGVVTPDGSATTWYFDYRRQGTDTWTQTPLAAAGSGSQDLRVKVTIDNLTPQTTYFYRLVAQNPGGTAAGTIRSFTTNRL